MNLTIRDKNILNFIKNQDFCFYKDIQKKFFFSPSTTSRRLNKLSRYGVLNIEYINTGKLKKVLDESSLNVIGCHKKIVFLKQSFLNTPKGLKLNRSKINHQVLLFYLKDQLESILKLPAILENEIKEKRNTLESGDHDPYPDFYLKGYDFKLAVELELNIKSQNRYDLKTVDYSLSSYSHVLYVVGSLKKKDKLLEYFSFKDRIGVAHYKEPETVYSYSYGKLSILDWIKKEGCSG